jgi:hypothetical protein
MVDTVENDGGERKYETGKMKRVQGGDGSADFQCKQFKINWRRFEIERNSEKLGPGRDQTRRIHTHHQPLYLDLFSHKNKARSIRLIREEKSIGICWKVIVFHL